METKWKLAPEFKGEKTSYMKKRWNPKYPPGLIKWINKPLIDPEGYSFWKKLVARYMRWKLVRKMKRDGIWDTLESFYIFSENLNIKDNR